MKLKTILSVLIGIATLLLLAGHGEAQTARGSGQRISGAGITLTTSGSSGAATLSGSTLNIPVYSGGSTVVLSSLLGATTTNTIDSAAWAQSWTWNSLTSQTALSLSSSTETSGKILSLSGTTSGSTGYVVYSSMTGNGNTGYAGYFANTATATGYALAVNGGFILPQLTTGYMNTNGSGSVGVTVPVAISGDVSINSSGVATITGIQGTSVPSVTGSGAAVLQNSPTITNTLTIGTTVTFSAATPSIASGFGSGASVTTGKDVAFLLNVGTGGSASTGVIAMTTTVSNGWNCVVVDQTSNSSFITEALSSTVTSVSLANYSRTTGIAGAWNASDVLAVNCTGR